MATHSGTEAHGGHDVGFPPFKTETYGSQLFWLAISFGLLYLLMAKLVIPRLGGILETRRKTIFQNLDEAVEMKKRAEAAGLAYDKALAEAKARAQGLGQAARDRLTADGDARRKDVEADLQAKLAQAETEIEAKKAAAMSHVRSIAQQAASEIVERLTGQAPAGSVLDSALDRAA